MSKTIPNDIEIITVTQLNNLTKSVLEKDFSHVWIQGEISSFTSHSSGHWYFSLKDENSTLSCVMFSFDNQAIQFEPQIGDNIILNGKATIYPPTGRFQLNVKHLELAGEGALLRAFEQLKLKLDKEGLFNADLKKPIPKYPKKVAVITSEDGVVIRDIINVLKRRSPIVHLTVISTSVQGVNSAQEICNAFSVLRGLKNIDLAILARGGGSIEDLWSFNEEKVAREIASLKIPIISAIGHETDFTISDFVSDLRAPTPSAAAEILSQNYSEIDGNLETVTKHLQQSISSIIQNEAVKIANLNKRIRHPGDKLREISQKADHLENILKQSIKMSISEKKNKTSTIINLINSISPIKDIKKKQDILKQQLNTLNKSIDGLLVRKNTALGTLSTTLEAVSPLSVLGRGYSILTKVTEPKVITKSSQLQIGDIFTAKLQNSSLKAKVVKINKSEN
tara:strand:- start:84300 stop:85655 length:1356 start_codon:yes stop_codon:yes gene_type:complete